MNTKTLSPGVRGVAMAIVLLLSSGPAAQADVDQVGRWLFSGLIDSNNPYPWTQKASHTQLSDLVKSNALTGVPVFDGFVANDWATGALDPSKYFSFSVTAINGYEVEYSHITMTLACNANTDWEIRSSVDGFATALDGDTVNGSLHLTADISALGRQLGTVEFRFYCYNVTGFNSRGLWGSGVNGVDLEVWGEVHTAPPSLAEWELTGVIDSSNPFPVTSTENDVTAGDLARSNILGSISNFASAFMASGWPTGILHLGRYLSFTTTAQPGYEIDYDRIEFSIYNSVSGAASWQVRSSADGFLTALDQGRVTNITVDGQDVTAHIEDVGTHEGTVEFRIYLYENTGTFAVDVRGLRGNPQGGLDLNVFGDVGAVVPSDAPVVARSTQLLQNHPNPFNPSTTIRFSLAQPGPVVLQLFDVRGHLVHTLIDGHRSSGWHTTTWNGRDAHGRMAVSGVYLVRLRAGDIVQIRRLTLMK